MAAVFSSTRPSKTQTFPQLFTPTFIAFWLLIVTKWLHSSKQGGQKGKRQHNSMSLLVLGISVVPKDSGGLQLCPMATARCKGDWEIKLKVLPTSIVKIGKRHGQIICEGYGKIKFFCSNKRKRVPFGALKYELLFFLQFLPYHGVFYLFNVLSNKKIKILDIHMGFTTDL